MDEQAERCQRLKQLLSERILVLDGAMGTGIQACELTATDFGGAEYEGCNENLVRTRPDVILDIHRSYLAAGADLIETDTFGGTPFVLADYGLAGSARELNAIAARLARQAAAEFSTPDRPRFVAGSIGPTTKAISVTGGVTFDELRLTFREQAAGLVEGGADILLVETCQDTRNVKAALLGIEEIFADTDLRLPLMVSGTIEPTGTMLAGQTIEAFYTSVQHAGLLAIGLNCATGPEFMTDHLRALAGLADVAVSCVPNAGLPDTEGRYLETPTGMARVLERFCDAGWLNLIGGCCGTTPDHIRALAEMAEGKQPRRPVHRSRTLFSGIDFVEVLEENRPLLVGERSNVIGSRKFKRLISEERHEEASEIARRQVKGGAQVIDICLANPDRDELADTDAFLPHVIRKVKVPLMIDSTDPAVIERALTYCQGKAIINSINLEDGEERFAEVVPLGRRYGAAFVVGTIDEDPAAGMAVTRERKLEVARRSFTLLTEKYGVPAEDIIWDPLTFPCATGDVNYVGSAVETIEGLRLLKAAFPATRSVLGISNVSFGLPPAGREILNSVFLYHATKAGLDLAIVNTERLERYASISAEERRLSEDLLWNRGEDPIGAFVARYRDASPRERRPAAELPLDERLANYIIEGSKEGLVADLEQKLGETGPLEIINGPLMAGMQEVGRLFNANELIVAEVLESAEAMKAAVSHLEPHVERQSEEQSAPGSATTTTRRISRGKLLLATVKGDVHDIGKNLVEILIGNNGYEVINLGIKVPPEALIDAVEEHQPDVVGLSGLLVKSAQMMVATATDMRQAGIRVPILVGGAALTEKFTRTRIAPAYGGAVIYAKDAMRGLDYMHRLTDAEARDELLARWAPVPDDEQNRIDGDAAIHANEESGVRAGNEQETRSGVTVARRSPAVRLDLPIPPVPDLERHVLELEGSRLDEIWHHLNPSMLYGRHLGLRGNFERLRTEHDTKALALEETVAAVQEECRQGAMRIGVVWQFFAAESRGNTLQLFSDADASSPVAEFEFPRQHKTSRLALPDFVLPRQETGRDHVVLFVTTAGHGIRALAERSKAEGEYVRSHTLQALALETAEAAAEWVHARLRSQWGFPDPPELAMADRFKAHYRGKRFSFGYASCPDLANQQQLFAVLRPEEIGIQLTEGYMMDPEASVSALVFHHPDARYFGVGAPLVRAPARTSAPAQVRAPA